MLTESKCISNDNCHPAHNGLGYKSSNYDDHAIDIGLERKFSDLDLLTKNRISHLLSVCAGLRMESWEAKVYKILCSELTQLYRDGCFTDIIIQVEAKQFQCHKVILSSFSPYFKAMFTVQMKESKESIVKLPFIDVATFERVLDFMYSGKDVVTRQAAFELLEAASFMQIGVLQEKCEEILLQNVSIGNCFTLWQFAKKLCCSRLENAAFRFILRNFPQMSEGDTLLHMTLQDLKSLFEDENIKIQNEDLVVTLFYDG
ncbi:hypothetical protein KUTeg_006437 [Tegillarca granosa]|uniref:BTB domain-containing protein n=1 Tax=Tegillarca granosa TaxID=220873 RepID=A0ABQ9FL21_TEGGR|nr:hypothetical protein KUTeg_006437 [Tegillarca granosa]